MLQTELWHDTIFDALGASVRAAGGVKKVAGSLWPALDPSSASSKMRSSLSAEHAQKLDLAELVLIMRLAKESGDDSIMQFLARELGYELRSLAPAAAKKRARKQRISTLLAEAARLAQEDE
jgi:hypothetical protein